MAHHLSSVKHVDQPMHDCITNCSECREICVAAETCHRCAQSCRAMAA